MRLAGRITEWNDDKGFGFVVPNGGGDRAFVHVNSFQRGSRRPVVGDLISYLPGKDERGRLQAREVRHAGQKIAEKRQRSRVPRSAMGLVALAAIVGLWALGRLPWLVPAAYVGMSGLAWLMYYFDKVAAGRGDQRIPEKALHMAGLFCGWPGALVAQQQFRHKTIKASFQATFWVTVVINVAGVIWLVSTGAAEMIAQSLAG